ncbi:flagellar biosynthetic protein FliO [Enterovibrio nigricans]|uniref:Flagellar protein n=1 Tax=Enterovibrio nigricans DSM 22720 TaxID=1121868 RepID=A0A1T4U7C5_9GAMM|nr:flagellar biosynthetic protein FliO [Enterovibrio nigricans]PKF51785.1 flagellar biosynthetic protein FliO [Enterovibrio nigricans]SKA48536.1 flagellar protein FliO/FliZ [Enterovibrio nigricans DSM 22720]
MAFPRLALIGLIYAPSAFAAAPDGESLATTFVALLFVIGLIFALAWLLKRMQVPSMMGSKSGLKVISQLPLGQKERVVVLDVNGEQVLVGVTANQITLIKSLDKPMETSAPTTSSFSSQLNQILKKNDAS